MAGEAHSASPVQSCPGPPLVSVVTATYNRSNVLRYAIDSVLCQTMGDWELLVIGDACTDDTAAVVAAYGDPRIRFVNLAQNVGEQSAPNNEGVRLSRGRYIAFLNHDDVWLPWHLATLVDAIDQGGADLVFSLASLVQPDGTCWLGGAVPGGVFAPHVTVPASTWLLRRSLADKVGAWRYFRDCYLAPSQDWLHRAHRLGASMHLFPQLSVIAIQSGGRARSYADRQDAEHRRLAERLRTEPDFLARELTALALAHARRDPVLGVSLAVRPYAARVGKNVVRRSLAALGLDTTTVRLWLRGPRGALIDEYRRTRGLEPVPRRKD